MEKRIKFSDGEQRRFLIKIQDISGLNIDGLAKIAHVTPRSFRDWKREKLNMTLNAALEFSSKYEIKLPEPIDDLEVRWTKYKGEIGKRGGIISFEKYGNPSTMEGMRKGGAKTLSILRQKGIIPQVKIYDLPKNYSEELAEFVGILLGDGSVQKSQLQITLNSKKDEAYSRYVSNLGRTLFGELPKVTFRKKQNAISIIYNGEFLINYLIKIGLYVGNKVKLQVDVPDWIKLSKKYRIVCLRGLVDTDGGVFIHKYKVNGKLYKYRKICFSNRSLPLLYFVRDVLSELGFSPKVRPKVANEKVWLYNEQEVDKYREKVGSCNERLLKQYNIP